MDWSVRWSEELSFRANHRNKPKQQWQLIIVFLTYSLDPECWSNQELSPRPGPGADPGFFLRGGALVSCSTSTAINHIVLFCRIPVLLENRRSFKGGAHPLHPPPRSAPEVYPWVCYSMPWIKQTVTYWPLLLCTIQPPQPRLSTKLLVNILHLTGHKK